MVTIKIRTDNDAFCGASRDLEVVRILRRLAHDIEQGDAPMWCAEKKPTGFLLYDVNGNTAGSVKVTRDR